MSQITPSRAAITGTTMTANNASAGGDSVANQRLNTTLWVINGSGGSINVTVAAQVTTRGGDATYPAQTVSNVVVAVGAGAQKLIGPFPAAYNDGNGNLQVTWSATSSVSFHAIDQSQTP